jgi:2-polyprenyl-3-methyl-5-hydroxy-6-metoxy-1,4-benzoquinol methylase
MSVSLEERRLNAAVASKGTSSNIIYNLVLRLLKSHSLTGDLLEYGSGEGVLISRLLDSGYPGTVTGVDILQRPASIPDKVSWLQRDLNYTTEISDGSFDVIVSTEVIEHLENPRATFREFHRLLRSKGSLIITTPNQESIRSFLGLFFRGHFISFLDGSYPAHITALLRRDFERICLETGFSAPEFYYTNSGGIPKWPRLSWQDATFGFLKGRLFSDNLALIARKQ